jgi:uncharacterized protein (DUF1697 family)
MIGSSRFVALIRGINVGGRNRIMMSDLRLVVEELGYTGVVTYIQSGNLMFCGAQIGDHATKIEHAINDRFGLAVPVVVRSVDELRVIASRHPDRNGTINPKFLHVWVLSGTPPADSVAAIDQSRFAPDRFEVIGREVYVSYPTGSGRSKLTIDVFEKATGLTATARNLNTIRTMAEIA